MSDEKLSNLLENGVILHNGDFSTSEDAELTRQIYETTKEEDAVNDEIFKILEQLKKDEHTNINKIVKDEPGTEPATSKFSFARVLQYFQQAADGYEPIPTIRVSRRTRSWNNCFIFYVQGSTFKVNRAPLNNMFPMDTNITYLPHLDMCYPDGTIGVWAPSQEDLFANDYYFLEDDKL